MSSPSILAGGSDAHFALEEDGFPDGLPTRREELLARQLQLAERGIPLESGKRFKLNHSVCPRLILVKTGVTHLSRPHPAKFR